jgi:hypothetical protein
MTETPVHSTSERRIARFGPITPARAAERQGPHHPDHLHHQEGEGDVAGLEPERLGGEHRRDGDDGLDAVVVHEEGGQEQEQLGELVGPGGRWRRFG